MSPASFHEALELELDPTTWRRQIGPATYLQGKTGPGASRHLDAIDLEHHGQALVRFRPGQPSLVRPYEPAPYTGRPQTTPRLLAAVNAALPAPLVSLELEAGRLVASTWRQARQVTLEPTLDWLDLADLAPPGHASWPPGTW